MDVCNQLERILVLQFALARYGNKHPHHPRGRKWHLFLSGRLMLQRGCELEERTFGLIGGSYGLK